MNVSNPPGPIGTAESYLIASLAGINANSAATTTLNWAPGLTAANTLPLFARVSVATGTLSLMVASIRLNTVVVQPFSAANSVLLGSGTDPVNFPISSAVSTTVIPASGNWDLTVGTINGTAATVNVSIYGLKIA